MKDDDGGRASKGLLKLLSFQFPALKSLSNPSRKIITKILLLRPTRTASCCSLLSAAWHNCCYKWLSAPYSISGCKMGQRVGFRAVVISKQGCILEITQIPPGKVLKKIYYDEHFVKIVVLVFL